MASKPPFAPLPPQIMNLLSQKLQFIGAYFSKRINIETSLMQAEMDFDKVDYLTASFITGAFYGIMILFLFVLFSIVLRQNMLLIGLPLSIAFFAFMFISTSFYPKIITKRRVRSLEKNLIPALRHLLIEIRAGVSLFDAMAAVSEGYGEVSLQFAKISKAISTGEDENDALNDATERNPSFQFRRAIWQINNALRAGSDVADALEAIINDLTQEQITSIKKYGQELNPWTMIYMLAAVIMPSLGITFLVIITSFSGAAVPKVIFPVILFGLLGFQVFFLNFVKTKRPAI